jgi:hypothetical protein
MTGIVATARRRDQYGVGRYEVACYCGESEGEWFNSLGGREAPAAEDRATGSR